MQRRTRKAIRLALIGGTAAALTFGILPAAQAATPIAVRPTETLSEQAEGPLDPSTYEGNLIVATDQGDIVVSVEPGEASLFLDRADGKLNSLSPKAARIVEESGVSVLDAEAGVLSEGDIGILAECGIWMNSVAGPGVYWTSAYGCAVAGYNGYQRGYNWSTGGTYLICAQGRGWNPGATWYGAGCSSTGGSALVPWGNTLAYTKMRANAIVAIFPIGYSWLT